MKHGVIILALAVLCLAGCGGGQTAPVSPNPTVLRWGIAGVGDVPTLDPALVSDPVSVSVASLIYGGLVRLDRQLHVQPDGAQRWTISPDGRTYTFSLRPSLRFADGTRVTAADFAHAIERALGPEGSVGAASFYLSSIVSVTAGHGSARAAPGIEVVNARTLRIRLTHPSAHFLAELAFPVSYVPEPGLAGRYGANWTEHAAGFGPYQVASWSHTRALRLIPNPYYWQGTPAFRSIRIEFPSSADAVKAYGEGRFDLVSGLQAGDTFAGGAHGTLRVPGLALDYLAFNTRRLPFYRLNARRAFAAAIRPHLVSAAMADTAFAATQLLPPAFNIPAPLWRPTSPASRYLAAARYPGGRGFPPLVLITPRDAGIRPLSLALANAWQSQLGVKIQVRPLDLASYQSVLARHTFDLALIRWGADYPDPQDFLATQLGPSPDNVTGWHTAQYDRQIALADSYAPSDARRAALFRQAASIAARKLPIVALDEPAFSALLRPDVRGVSLTALGTVVVR